MPPPSLRELQAGFWRSLQEEAVPPALASAILPSAALEPAERVAIYRRMYFWRLHEVLREDYPKTCEALGDGFEDVVRRYLAAHPSEHPFVRHLGRHVPAFLTDDATARERPWLADLARLERARVDAFDAPDAVTLDAAALRAVEPDAWPRLRLAPIPALAIVRSPWPVHQIWAAPVDAPPRASTVVRVWRQAFTVFHAAMDPVEDAALAAMSAGWPFAEICEAVAEHVDPDEAPREAGALLARWLEDGLVAAGP